jgi:hypothetical protein
MRARWAAGGSGCAAAGVPPPWRRPRPAAGRPGRRATPPGPGPPPPRGSVGNQVHPALLAHRARRAEPRGPGPLADPAHRGEAGVRLPAARRLRGGGVGDDHERVEREHPPGALRVHHRLLADERRAVGPPERVPGPEAVGHPADPGAHQPGLRDRVVPVDPDGAAVGDEEARRHQQEVRLAGTVGPDERGHLAGAGRQADVVDREDAAERPAPPVRGIHAGVARRVYLEPGAVRHAAGGSGSSGPSIDWPLRPRPPDHGADS